MKKKKRKQCYWSQRPAIPCWVFVIWTRFKVSCGCLLMKRNVYLWITRWKPILLCGGYSQSHQTSIKVLVKCLLDFFIIHLEALRLAPYQNWHGSLLKDLYTYATAIPERCQESENVSKHIHTMCSQQASNHQLRHDFRLGDKFVSWQT